MTAQPILIDGRWRPAHAAATFRAENPTLGEPLPDEYPISTWQDCDEALAAADRAFAVLRTLPGGQLAEFLEDYAARLEARQNDLVELAHLETALPRSPRLAGVELPRTTNQLRQAAAAAREGSWSLPTIDSRANIRSYLAPIGPVWVFGPNNFPLAFGSISGGDFAAAIAAGNPVIAKANSSHPGTTRMCAEEAEAARQATGLPAGTVQLIYRTGHADGERAVADPRTGATGYTGARSAGLKLKAAADAAGKPIYLELSSVNPVVILPGALRERGPQLAEEFTSSCLMGTGQFCTNPGLVLLVKDEATDAFVRQIAERFQAAPVGTLLSRSVESSLRAGVQTLCEAGAQVLAGGTSGGGQGYSHANTLLSVTGRQFLEHAAALQTEAFGNCSLLVIADNVSQLCQALEHLEGNLTGCVVTDTGGSDDAAYDQIAPRLRQRVGRLLNDKMPTGVAVSPAMNHGGPYPATGHPGFTAVGIPASLRRFAALHCYDNVRPHRLPPSLQDKNPNGAMWRLVDGRWTQSDVGA
jgi:NADP-dependent aldehyde dehydrogenase